MGIFFISEANWKKIKWNFTWTTVGTIATSKEIWIYLDKPEKTFNPSVFSKPCKGKLVIKIDSKRFLIQSFEYNHFKHSFLLQEFCIFIQEIMCWTTDIIPQTGSRLQ